MPDRLPAERRVHIGMKREQFRGHRGAEKQHARSPRERAQGVQAQGRPAGHQHRAQGRRVRAGQRLGHGKGYMWPVLAMGAGRQAGQASVGQSLPQPPDRGIRLVVKVHFD